LEDTKLNGLKSEKLEAPFHEFPSFSLLGRDGNGSGSDWVDQKSDPWKNVVGLNLTLEPEPVGEIWHPKLNLSDFGSGLDARQIL
jgi:hypothetical protein